MANSKKQAYIAVPSQIITSLSSSSLQSLLLSPKKSRKTKPRRCINPRLLCFFPLFLFAFLGMLNLWLKLGPISPFSPFPCGITNQDSIFSSGFVPKSDINNGFLKTEEVKEEKRETEINNQFLENAIGEKQSITAIKDSIFSSGFIPKSEINGGFLKTEEAKEEEKETETNNDFLKTGEIAIGEKQSGITNQDSIFSSGFVPKSEIKVGFLKTEEIEREIEIGEKQSRFWEQPDGLGFKPCLDFSRDYKKISGDLIKNRKKYLMVVVSGGLNQQRNQIVDAVVIARVLGAALVVPILQINVIWGDESEFADIFDLDHFKNVLANDVRIVSALPSTHVMSRRFEEKLNPGNITPQWIRVRYKKKFKRDGVVLLRGLDSRLTKDLHSDLQKLRCKVAFHALKFAPKILELGNKLTERMRNKGPYIALHLRMEIDVWVRTGCQPGLSSEYDEIISNERKRRPELLTSKSNMTSHERKLAGLCPLNAVEVTRLLKALGAPRDARIYWAGGDPLGGKDGLAPLRNEFPNLYNKGDLALPGELNPYTRKASFMAAIDYIVAENSDVFMPSHGGNMGHALQGHRAYAGHKKYITPNKRKMLPYFLDSSLPGNKFNKIIINLHKDSLGQPNLRTSKIGRDVTKFPIPECMCNNKSSNSHSSL